MWAVPKRIVTCGLSSPASPRAYGNAWLILFLTTLFWGGNVVAARRAVGEISPMALVCLRWAIVSLVLVLAMRRRLGHDLGKLRPSWRFVTLMGAAGFTAYNALYFTAAHETTGVNLAIIQGVSPAFILIGAKCVFGLRIGVIRWLGLLLTLAGIALVATRGDLAALAGLRFNSGDLLMILASTIYAGYTLALPGRPAVSAFAFFTGLAFAAFLTSLPLLFAEIAAGRAIWPNLTGLVVLAYVALFPSLLAQVFFIRGVELIGPARAGLFYNLVPVIGALLAVVFLGERFEWYDGASLALVVAGITLAEQQRQRIWLHPSPAIGERRTSLPLLDQAAPLSSVGLKNLPGRKRMAPYDRCYNIADLRNMARRRLPKGVFDYLDLGAEDQVALRNNRRAFEDLKMRNRVMVDVSDVRVEAEIFGKPATMPLAIAPTGIAGLCWYQGELELAKAAAAAGIPFTLATGSNTSMEKIANEAGGRLWFQLYMWREKELSYELVKRAARAGFEALIWTVDIGHGANREHNARNGFGVPYKLNRRSVVDVALHPDWLVNVLARYIAAGGMPRHENYPAKYQGSITGGKAASTRAMRADKVGLDDINRLRDIWPGTLMVKGILHPEDALNAIAHGADAIVVSNHGGRNMDSAESSLVALPEIVAAVGGKVPVILDSGIRRGSDIVKALGLGADLVLSGRATLYGTAVGGQKGAERALKLLKDELVHTMAYIGCSRIKDITSSVFADKH